MMNTFWTSESRGFWCIQDTMYKGIQSCIETYDTESFLPSFVANTSQFLTKLTISSVILCRQLTWCPGFSVFVLPHESFPFTDFAVYHFISVKYCTEVDRRHISRWSMLFIENSMSCVGYHQHGCAWGHLCIDGDYTNRLQIFFSCILCSSNLETHLIIQYFCLVEA